jgi:hypothetical protein
MIGGNRSMRKIKPLLILICMGAFVSMSYGQLIVAQRLFTIIDAKFNEELSDIDFSQDELKKLKAFIHHGIQTKSSDELDKNFDLIIKNSHTLIENYEDENTACKANQEGLGNPNYVKINQDCFQSTINKMCPLYPFC